MPASIPNTMSYVKHLEQLSCQGIEQEKINLLFNSFKSLSAVRYPSMPAFYLIDYTEQQYLLLSESTNFITSYTSADFEECGLGLLLDVYNTDDFKIFNEKIFTTNMDVLRRTPAAQRDSLMFSYNFRIRAKNGNFIPLFQRGSYLTSPDGLPLFSYGTLFDITCSHPANAMHHLIEQKAYNHAVGKRNVILNHTHFTHAEDAIFTPREKEVLKWIAEGFSSKQIAVKLNIAENTVANHRKAMMGKTNTENIAQLVALSIRNQLI